MRRMLHDVMLQAQRGPLVGKRPDITVPPSDATGLRQIPIAEMPPPGRGVPPEVMPPRAQPLDPKPARPVDPAQTPRVPISGRAPRLEPPLERPLNMPSGPPAAYGWDNLGATAAPPRYVDSSPNASLSREDVMRGVSEAREDLAGPAKLPASPQELERLKGQLFPITPWPHGTRFMEAGVPGTGIFSGFISAATTGEFNPQMFGWNAMRIYEQMRRTDADVAAALFAMKLPIFSVMPEIIPGEGNGGYTGDGNLAGEIAQFARENLFGGLERENPNYPGTYVTQAFREVKENAFLMLDFGCSAHENLYRIDGDKYKLRFLAPRMPWPLALDTPVPALDGWKTVGTLRVGDRVFDENGQIQTVEYKTPVFHGHPCYRVNFADGMSVVADSLHTWETETMRERFMGCGPRSRTTQELYFTQVRPGKKSNHSVKITAPLQYPAQKLLIDPYVLGCWLGDGTSSAAKIAVNNHDVHDALLSFARADYGISFHQEVGCIEVYVRGLRTQLKALGVFNNKHVPEIYLRSSVEQRRALLAGLLDTDGCVTKGGRVEFVNTNKRLIDAVVELARSLGELVRVAGPRVLRKGKKIYNKQWWTVGFRPENCPFRFSRKIGAFHGSGTELNFRKHRHYITSVEPIKSVPVQCIGVSGESHLFLVTKSFIPTHNSFYRFWTADDGETLTGLEQLGYRRERYVSTTVPAPNLCLFTNRMEGSNFFGIGSLRSAYSHWYVKTNMYKLDAIAFERNGMGIPWIKFPPGAKSEDITKAQQWVNDMAVSERSGLALPDGYTFEIAGLRGRVRDPVNSIRHHSQEIVRSVMAMFIALGTTETGSRALANTLLDLFRQSLQHYAGVFCSTFNNFTLKPLIDLNYTPKSGHRLPYPWLSFPSIVVIDPTETANMLQKLGQSQVGLINNSVELEKAVLQKFGLPYGAARTKFAPVVTQVRIMAQPAGEETVKQVVEGAPGIEEQKPLVVPPGAQAVKATPSGGIVPEGKPAPPQQPSRPPSPMTPSRVVQHGVVAPTGKGDEYSMAGTGTEIHDVVNEITHGRTGTSAARKGEKEQENPRKYRFSDIREFQGIPLFIEQDIGETREGVNQDGTSWETTMRRPYGRITGVKGLDQEEMDVFVGPYRKAKNVYVAVIRDPQRGTIDEEKVMLGFRGIMEAKNALLEHYDSPEYFHSIRSIPLGDFKQWLGLLQGRKQFSEEHPPEIGIDLDDTLAKGIDDFDPDKVGSLIPSAVKKVKKFQQMGFKVWIFTARTDLAPVRRWSKKIGLDLPVTNKKRHEFAAIIDNKAINAEESVEETVKKVKELQ